jgi:hypothetical protein
MAALTAEQTARIRAEGKGVREIAAELGVSTTTVTARGIPGSPPAKRFATPLEAAQHRARAGGPREIRRARRPALRRLRQAVNDGHRPG